MRGVPGTTATYRRSPKGRGGDQWAGQTGLPFTGAFSNGSGGNGDKFVRELGPSVLLERERSGGREDNISTDLIRTTLESCSDKVNVK